MIFPPPDVCRAKIARVPASPFPQDGTGRVVPVRETSCSDLQSLILESTRTKESVGRPKVLRIRPGSCRKSSKAWRMIPRFSVTIAVDLNTNGRSSGELSTVSVSVPSAASTTQTHELFSQNSRFSFPSDPVFAAGRFARISLSSPAAAPFPPQFWLPRRLFPSGRKE